MPNRSMQAKFDKARSQAMAYALDMADRAAMRRERVTEADIAAMVAAFHARKEAERVARATVAENIRTGLGQSARAGLAAKYRR